MPELPEVQTVVTELQERLRGRRFAPGAQLLWPPVAGYPDPHSFPLRLAHQLVRGVHRRGKYILIDLAEAEVLVVHLRMTGNLHFAEPSAPEQRHMRARLPLMDGEELRFADMRKFGRLYVGSKAELQQVIPVFALGPEPLDPRFTAAELVQILHGRHGAIKPLLLNQHLIAGLGNIYADEALFRAGIDPRRPADSLTAEEATALHTAIQSVLSQAIANGGTSFRNYLSTWGRKGTNQDALFVFRRTGEPCPRCGTALERHVVGGRGTHICPHCQR
jgi:formamidopyrimidine-DNA glycosylase